MSFIQGKSFYRRGEDSGTQTVERSSRGMLGNCELYGALEEEVQKHCDWLVGPNSSSKAN